MVLASCCCRAADAASRAKRPFPSWWDRPDHSRRFQLVRTRAWLMLLSSCWSKSAVMAVRYQIEGNSASAIFGSGTCATGQAPSSRSMTTNACAGRSGMASRPSGRDRSACLESLTLPLAAKQQVVLLSGTITTLPLKRSSLSLGKRDPNFRHVVYDAVSLSAMAANAQSFGQAAIPHYSFDKARIIVGLEARLSGTWLPGGVRTPVRCQPQAGRNAVTPVQFESGMSVTGSNADVRVTSSVHRSWELSAVAPAPPDSSANGALWSQWRRSSRCQKAGRNRR